MLVVFGGKNINFIAFNCIIFVCARQLSTINATFRFSWNNFLSKETSHLVKIVDVEFGVYFVGKFLTFLKQRGFKLLPITYRGNFSDPSELHATNTVIRFLDLFPPEHLSPLNDSVLSGRIW